MSTPPALPRFRFSLVALVVVVNVIGVLLWANTHTYRDHVHSLKLVKGWPAPVIEVSENGNTQPMPTFFFALVFNIFFIMGILAQLNAALTLPGIAGIVLTIGMSIDANVLIFERIREEMRRGVQLKEAISLGYKKAHSSIIDANVTTFLTAVILYSLGQGPVKGFAVTLMIGIASSFFSAVYITRVIIEQMTRKGDKSKFNFKTVISAGVLSNMGIDFMIKRYRAYLFSATFIIIGMVLISVNGLNLGVDFKGGRSYVVSFGEPVVASTLKTELTKGFEGAGTEVKTFGSNSVVKVTTSYKVDDESDEADLDVVNALVAGVATVTGKTFIEGDKEVDS